MTTYASLPSAAIGDAEWERAHQQLLADLQGLIRLPTVNPPGDEIVAARYVDALLADIGLEPEVVEPFPGRGSIHVRLHGDGTGGSPLLLLSHLDVVPAAPDGWTHDPFSGDIADGYLWGRGAVDMKSTVAVQLGVLRLLAAEARAAGRDPAADPIPGLRRDVLFTSTADEEAGGHQGAGWVAGNRPEWLRADAAVNEAGGVSMRFANRRFYPIQVAEKGFAVYRLTVRGVWGHGSMPREENAAVRAATAIARLAAPGAPRITPVMRRFFQSAAAALPEPTAGVVRRIADPDPTASESAIEALCREPYRRAARALLRDTISIGIVASGVKYNVIPGVAEVQIDCRVLPDTSEDAMRAEVRRRLGDDLAEHVDVELANFGAPVEAPSDHPILDLLGRTIQDHDAEGIPVPVMAPFATDAKHLVGLGVPCFGFTPLRNPDDERWLERFHGVDERVSLDALRFGLPVLYDVVRRFCG